ncbi:hypothetical protein G7047_19025 [Diaphorobacter sp. HDW4A]|uniref:hypothetical protein n=1 Tax=Diaphorobacter sp. HDW4A TaxID=2714924 RepID=UPI00140DC362|nr:hypothetical protein [Diaphorobacter sp. HDW4A]QIL81774.1 hypothetical protein G7047_19025 [Diaphorobacter sp. HDW4A]
MSRFNLKVKCTRCRNQHMESDRKQRPNSEHEGWTDSVCPRCGCKSYYDMSPQVAWCWRSGEIEIGDALPVDKSDGSGAIEIARGPISMLKGRIAAKARHGYRDGKLFVPGIPESSNDADAVKALDDWLAWCGRFGSRDGVIFSKPGVPENILAGQ